MGRMIRGVRWQWGAAWELGKAPITEKERHGYLCWPHNVWNWATPEAAAAIKQLFINTTFDKDPEANAQIKAECLQAIEEEEQGILKHDAELHQWVREQEAETAFRQVFRPTHPLWFGLWTTSPLSPVQCHLLLPFLAAAWQRYEQRSSVRFAAMTESERARNLPRFQEDREEVGAFLRALNGALEEGVPLYVEVIPHGHVDLGWRTLFPHCPCCKVDGPTGQTTEITCAVCGTRYIPAATSSMTPLDFEKRDD